MRERLRPAFFALAVFFCGLMIMPDAKPVYADALRDHATLTPLAFDAIPGWAQDDHLAAFVPFQKTCRALIDDQPALRGARPAPAALLDICRDAVRADVTTGAEARRFFERHFIAHAVQPLQGAGFITGYYEPEVAGALTRSAEFPWPLRARPAHLVTLTPETALRVGDDALVAALQTLQGLQAVPDRDRIENGALDPIAPPLVYVRDETEALLIHIQGSTRIRLTNGNIIRLAYAGRNGYPFTSPARLIAQEHGVAPEDLTLEKFKSWLRAHGDVGRDLIRRNRSYIFFRIADELQADDGPIGGAGIPLAPGRSLAIDRALWPYGLPFFIRSEAQGPDEKPLARLMVAQDTGSAIIGPARGDVFFGSGAAMGVRAGNVRHAAEFFVLLPK